MPAVRFPYLFSRSTSIFIPSVHPTTSISAHFSTTMAIVPKANANADNDAQQQLQQQQLQQLQQMQIQQQQVQQPPPTAISNLQTPATPTAPTANPNGIVLNSPPNPLRSKTRSMSIANKTYEKSFKQAQGSVGLFVTNELETAIERCKAKVQATARICRMRNHKFR
jgi:hypothetical protein